ncbi:MULTISPECIES: TIR domain-containing protein [unclassified Granulicatella]|uniref:TIR domain-containing protein n=1 Tax=unclassified Granulicatella TaxID=2630493 RepID=UPI0010738C94|nr:MULTISPECIES: TIR domain-containing protein [unclassified Granulicatella]MBF0781160.1 TIR domain-containing protein [Granulicatella sp. 19428wC4_WM01]TFU91613.1 molecular chaperone Tir [Granulicatella sp. WM01]
MTKHKCFISFKTEDIEYKKYIQNNLDIDYIDKSLNVPIHSEDEDYIMQKIREDYLKDSTITIHLIGECSSEDNKLQNQYFIKKELQASLSNTVAGSRNGILGVVLPSMYDNIYKGSGICTKCDEKHKYVCINDETVIKEFSYNYYLPNPKSGCSWGYDDRYCVLTKWDDFIENPERYIDLAFDKRETDITKKIKVRP